MDFQFFDDFNMFWNRIHRFKAFQLREIKEIYLNSSFVNKSVILSKILQT